MAVDAAGTMWKEDDRAIPFSKEEVMPMEQFLLNVLAAIVAGIVVALINRKMR